MRELGGGRPPETDPDAGPHAFAAFVLEHAACGDGVFELRLGERCILEWCAACADLRTFVSPDA